MKCPCGIDHWFWVASGLQGVASMMQALEVEGIPPTRAAVDKLKVELDRLLPIYERQREKLTEA